MKSAAWALGHQAALACGGEQGERMAAVARLDNLSWTALRLLQWWENGLPGFAARDGWQILWAGRTLILANDRVWAEEALRRCRGERSPGETPARGERGLFLPFPAQGLLWRLELPERWRERIAADSGWTRLPVTGGQGAAEFDGETLRLRSRIGLDPSWASFLVEEAGPIRYAPRPDTPLAGGEAVLSFAASLPVRPLWQRLGSFMDATAGRPTYRSSADAMPVAAWEMAEQGVVAHADGRVALALYPAPAVAKALPVPKIELAFGCDASEEAAARLRAGAEKMVAILRVPAVDPSWEAVCRQTRLEAEDTAPWRTRFHLHPLAFHNLSPEWRSAEQAGAILFSTHAPAPARLPAFDHLIPARADGGGGLRAAAELAWQWPEKEAAGWTALLLDKADSHGWAAEEELPRLRRLAQAVTAFATLFPAGSAAAEARRGDPGAGNERLFWLDSRLVLALQE